MASEVWPDKDMWVHRWRGIGAQCNKWTNSTGDQKHTEPFGRQSGNRSVNGAHLLRPQ